MTTCPTYLVPFGSQLLQGGATGSVDCTAWAQSRVIAAVTCGVRVPSGRRIRLQSDEPVPDPRSPGLNLVQVAEVALEHYGVHMDVRTGLYALDWDEYEARRRNGEPMVVQVGYGPIEESPFSGARFRGGHAIFEDRSQTIDSLADGRRAGIYEYRGPLVYPRSLIREAAGELVIDSAGRKVGAGRVWCAIGSDTAPEYQVVIRPRTGRERRAYRVYAIGGGRITSTDARRTAGFAAPCDPPRAVRFPAKGNALRWLVRIAEGRHRGAFVNRHWSRRA